ncbi:MAG TPA: BNR repeat-containing protein [Flavitalea sp.]|nr:BNR repeat-containing protein [Flavitalea sp.]
MNRFQFTLAFFLINNWIEAQRILPIGEGWSGTTINTVVFRKNSVVSHKQYQYAAYYDASGKVVLAKRTHGADKWELHKTALTGNIRDAHNSISIMTDGDGYLHVAWDHHNNPLNYTKSKAPGSLDLLEPQQMTGNNETKLTYPEFFRLANGDLLFLYRDGSSGNGNLILNRYNTRSKTWVRINSNLLDGEGERNAYWQACVDDRGTFHISWVWRETPDVASNHDLCYAKSEDGGKTWMQSDGKKYELPINSANAEYIRKIPQASELINATSMTTDEKGLPYIATYWRPVGTNVPQYHLVYFDGKKWNTQQVSNRTTPFSLSGGGTKKIPISRPQVVVKGKQIFVVFRDIEREEKLSLFICDDVSGNIWRTIDLTGTSIGQSEPSYDTELWRLNKQLHVFVQRTGQGDGEKVEDMKPQMVHILEWSPGSR